MIQVDAIQKVIHSGRNDYPIYVGFLTAKQLLGVAEVPNFQNDTTNHDIATNVLTPPIKEWQRPLIERNKENIINTFDGTGEFMPNPVLVAERCIGGASGITINRKIIGGMDTGMIEINIPEPNNGNKPPLWIIDGQHRINGLGDVRCRQNDNFIPVVFLLNLGGGAYNGRNLAKIFAQVTTEATPLKPLHKEWLTYAFKLDNYGSDQGRHDAMSTVAHLCKTPHNSITNLSNGFHDDIKFNDGLADCGEHYLGDHCYDCQDLANFIHIHYYSKQSNFDQLGPEELSMQVSTAFECLRQTVTAPLEKSVFFGEKKYHHKIMCDAFLLGALTYLRNGKHSPDESDWKKLLEDLKFHETDWNFHQHVDPQIRWVEKSKKLAFAVFNEIFKIGKLPENVNDVWDYLSGDRLELTFEFKFLNDNNKPKKADMKSETYGRGDKKSFTMDGRKFFRISKKSTNAQHIEIVDGKSNPASPVKFSTKGESLLPPKVKSDEPTQQTLMLTITCTLYGGNTGSITLSLKDWNK